MLHDYNKIETKYLIQLNLKMHAIMYHVCYHENLQIFKNVAEKFRI